MTAAAAKSLAVLGRARVDSGESIAIGTGTIDRLRAVSGMSARPPATRRFRPRPSSSRTRALLDRIRFALVATSLLLAPAAHAETITVAAAADLKYALDEIVAAFESGSPAGDIAVVYGSSGKFQTQIRQGAPYDLYFSADIEYPRALAEAGFAASEVRPYAIGRIVLWSATLDATKMTLARLLDPAIARIAIANPRHAPYGRRAEEALRASGLWERVEPKLVFGENIAHTAQFVQTGNAQVGILALSLALSPELASRGGYWLIPDDLHEPLEQGFILTKRAAGNALARRFADYVASAPARAVMTRYGFLLPTVATHRSKGGTSADR